MRARSLFRPAALAACLAVAGLTVPGASAEPEGWPRYVGGGTAVVRGAPAPAPFVDEGTVVCDNGEGVGAGGLCLPFGGGDAVQVLDAAVGENVAFQVCVDNNGDGACTSPDPDPDCPDQIAFSHDDAGNFFNPVGPVPTGFLSGCPGGQWHGYIVYLCEGAHVAGGTGHVHPATTGTASVTGGGEGLGTFCGGSPAQSSRKPYVLENGNLTCGMTTSNDPTGNVDNDPNNMIGALYAGPWRVVEPSGATVSDVTITCTLQFNQADHGAGGISRTSTTSGNATALADTIGYATVPGDQLYLCTTVVWNSTDGTGAYVFDADGTTAGLQCALATRVERPAENYRGEFVLQSPAV